MRILGIAALAASLGACATGGSIDYLHTEYGGAQADGTVTMGTPEMPEEWKIWLHKTKPKMVVQPPLSAAFNTGLAKGATFGAVDASPVQPTFERAGLKYLDETKGPGCRLSHPARIHELIWEFDYDCAPSASTVTARAPSTKRR